ncbi:MAG: hypothetical protein JEZ00_08680 [Anaerolineaceae bacterium]|nr:hypothetical protein [Anaerolineaceae bacterium]
MDEDLNHFLSHWFQGYMDGLGQLDQADQEKMLAACGLACAKSYTAQCYQEAWQAANGDLSEFLTQLSKHFPEAKYDQVDEHTIEVRYQYCDCDLVTQGWVKSALLCRCSLHNLGQNFMAAMGQTVQVKLQSSILAGDNECRFEVCI